MSSFEYSNYEIRPVASQEVPYYLEAGVLDLHPRIAQELPEAIEQERASFYVAMTEFGEALGQIGIKWDGPSTEPTRHILGLAPGEGAPQTGFLKVWPEHRQRGIATELVKRACDEVTLGGYRTIFGKYALNNQPMERLFASLGYTFTDLVLTLSDYQRNAQGEYGEPVPTDMRVVYRRLGQYATMP